MVGKRSTKQWGTETIGYMWKGEGWGRVHRVNKMDITGTFRRENRKFEGVGLVMSDVSTPYPGICSLAHNGGSMLRLKKSSPS